MSKFTTDLALYLKTIINKTKNSRAKDKEDNPQQQFQVELELIEGIHQNNNSYPSIIHFSFNKAATQYVKSILIKLAVENGMTPVGINDYAFNTKFPFLDHLTAEEMKKYCHIFKKQGYLYSLFGGMVEGIPELDQYKVVFAVRDPRDMLVSSYYSQAFSHPAPDAQGNKLEGFMQRREFALKSSIDDYVIWESDKIYSIFHRYNELLLHRHPNILILKYEDMINNFSHWLRCLIDYSGLQITSDTFESIVTNNSETKPLEENINQHLRKGIAGDYKEKLQPKTIDYLNNKLSTMLYTLDYKL